MPWPSWLNTSKSKQDPKDEDVTTRLTSQPREAANTVTNTKTREHDHFSSQPPSSQLRAFTAPQTIIATVILTTATLSLYRFYKIYLRRIPEAVNVPQRYFAVRKSILGKVTSVGDGDNFRLYHTPGGWLAGWGWLPWRSVPKERKDLKAQTVHIRLAGIDAPELAHFGRPAQPYGQEALEWLTSYLQGRRVRAYLHRPDQYSRAVATVYVWKGFLRRDVGLQMLRAGLATVYEAKTGAEFGEGLEQKYRNAEWWAKTKRKGMWTGSNKSTFESPREYKTRYGSGGEAHTKH